MPVIKEGPKRFPGPNSVDELGVEADPSLLDTEYTDTFRILFDQNPTTTTQAYMALSAAFFAKIRDDAEPAPTDKVEVPVWALQAVTKGFMIYRDAVLQGKTLRFGEAMGFESKGKGKKPRLVKEHYRLRDLHLALAIAKRKKDGMKVTEAIRKLSKEFPVGERTAMRIWAKNKNFAEECLNNFLLPSPR